MYSMMLIKIDCLLRARVADAGAAIRAGLWVVVLWSSAGLAALPEVHCDGAGVCREEGTGVPLMVLPRSFSHLYADPDFKQVLVDNIPAFVPLFVFRRQLPGTQQPGQAADGDSLEFLDSLGAFDARAGRYQVGRSEQGPPVGWMRADDVIEWRQALTVAYTHPGVGEEARQPVLMFRQLRDLKAVVEADAPELAALKLYERIDNQDIPPQVISREPREFADISQGFYLLPVIESELIDLNGDEARYLLLASAVPENRADANDPDTLDNPRFAQGRNRGDPRSMDSPDGSGLSVDVATLELDIVFVMDMTLSMQPYLDSTREAITAIARIVGGNGLKDRVRFGLVGFRDDIRAKPALGFTSRNFTPELVTIEDFVALLGDEARAATISSPGFDEEVFAGIEAGLDANWRDNSLRFIVLVGDAGSHPVGHPQNTTGKDAEILRMAARDRNVHLLAIRIVNPRFARQQARAKEQFSRLTLMRGSVDEDSAMVEVQSADPEGFRAAVDRVDGWVRALYELQLRGPGALDVEPADGPGPTGGGAGGGSTVADDWRKDQVFQQLFRTALVEYLGRRAIPPRDISAWALDRDLTNPSVRSLDVRVLLTKAQLSDLTTGLRRLMEAMDRARIPQVDFFDALQGLAAGTMKNPEALGRIQVVRESGVLPLFIAGLPYRSEILNLDRGSFASMTAEQRADLYNQLHAKLAQYIQINSQVDDWVVLNPGAAQERKVFPLQLGYLP